MTKRRQDTIIDVAANLKSTDRALKIAITFIEVIVAAERSSPETTAKIRERQRQLFLRATDEDILSLATLQSKYNDKAPLTQDQLHEDYKELRLLAESKEDWEKHWHDDNR